MRLTRSIFLLLFLAGGFIYAVPEAKSVPLAGTPAAVQTTIHAQLGDGTLAEIDQTNEDGESTFDVSFTTQAGEENGFTVAEDGTLLSVEVALADAPVAVRETIRAQAPGWQLDDLNKNVAEADVSYDADVSKDGRDKSFSVAEDGELLSMSLSLPETSAAVQEVIKREIAGGSVKSIEENFDADGNSFDVDATGAEGGPKSFSVSSDGKLLSREVKLAQLTPAGRRAVREQIGGGKILRIDKMLAERKEGVPPYYDVEGRKDRKPFNFSIGLHGRFLGMDE